MDKPGSEETRSDIARVPPDEAVLADGGSVSVDGGLLLFDSVIVGTALDGPSDGTPLARTILVTSCVVAGLPIVGGKGVAIVEGVAAGWIVAVMTPMVFSVDPGTLSQTSYTPILSRSIPLHRESRHWSEPSPIVRPEVAVDVQR